MTEWLKRLRIENFKSVKELELECKRVNFFIGEPNAGKSNILEALGLLSFAYYGEENNIKGLSPFVRCEKASDIFYYGTRMAEISINNDIYTLKWEGEDIHLLKGDSELIIKGGVQKSRKKRERQRRKKEWENLERFKFYRFRAMHKFPREETRPLLPPDGKNLLQVLLEHDELKDEFDRLFQDFGLKVELDISERKISIQHELRKGVVTSVPYSLISDTLQRFIFHIAAIYTNENSVLVFEEPEAHAFPFYTADLAERIASDSRNQYFISTHNPSFVIRVIEKAKEGDVSIFATSFKEYTRVTPLKTEDVLEFGSDFIYNLDALMQEEE
ncbi:MAG: AAA family ATPase [Candidatus Methanospirare jalkutatii]|nr:AAA family ATPase [Candidatus Methanospirare jalkutatii]MCW7079511.1 AAA family ATPase [Candidatus Methanospirare jalkutatii]